MSNIMNNLKTTQHESIIAWKIIQRDNAEGFLCKFNIKPCLISQMCVSLFDNVLLCYNNAGFNNNEMLDCQ